MANAFIAQGVAPIQIENPLNQMARLYAIKGAQQEQAMREQTMAEQNALRQLLATNPDLTSGAALNQLARIGPTGLAYGTKLMDIELERNKQRAAQFKLTQDKTAYFRDALNDVNTPEAARQWTAAFYSDPDLAPSLRGLGKTVEQAVSSIPTDPEGFQQWKQQQTLGATEFLKLNKPTYMQQDFGADTRIVSLPGLGVGGMTVVPGTAGAKTTPEYQTQRLAFDREKFEWEKRNPGQSIIEAETGFYRVDKQTGKATPITLGEIQQGVAGTAPAAAAPAAAAPTPATTPGQLRPTPKMEAAEKAEYGKLLVKQYDEISTAARQATRTIPALESSLAILDKADFGTGFGTETKAAAARVLGALGIEKADQYASNAQIFMSNAMQAILQRQYEQKGTQTEGDAQRIREIGAQLGNTKEANRFLLTVAKAQLQRDIDQRDFYAKWRRDNKTYDGAEDAWMAGEGSKSLFDTPTLKDYSAKIPSGVTTAPAGGRPPLDQIFGAQPQRR